MNLLHVHYSGIVRNKTLIDHLLKHENIDISEKGNVFFTHEKHSQSNEKLKEKIEHVINKKDTFKNIGNLWYFIIKNVRFFYKYNCLIIREMKQQKIDHIEFRIKLGSHFDGNKKLSIQKELSLFYKCRKLYKLSNKSFKIICSVSKSVSKEKVYQYFNNIVRIVCKKPYLKDLISGFDIVGDEISGNSLSYYRDEIIRLRKKTDIPFFFHAGEHNHHKSIENIKFAIKHGGNRIGHGIYCINDVKLMNRIK